MFSIWLQCRTSAWIQYVCLTTFHCWLNDILLSGSQMVHFMIMFTQIFASGPDGPTNAESSKTLASLDASKLVILLNDTACWWLGIYNMYLAYHFHLHVNFSCLPHVVCLFLQVCADDVLTKEEQIGLLFRAKRKCEGNIKTKHKIPGE